jgi:uncharacterized protein involved in tolerance to divalent cations
LPLDFISDSLKERIDKFISYRAPKIYKWKVKYSNTRFFS